MKKIISGLICIMMLCTAVAFAAETETVGGTITLTQFLGVDRENAKSVSITITMNDADFETVYVNKNAFYDISDNYMLTSAFEPEPITQEGVYITIEKTDGSLAYAFIGQSGGVDRYSTLMSRMPHALYTTENPSAVMSLINSSNDTDFNDIKNHWAKDTIEKWKDKGVISGYPDGTFKPDNPVTRAELAKILTLAFDLQPSEFVYSDRDLSEDAWYYNYLLCAGKYIPNYALPEINEKNQPYVDNSVFNAFLPEQNAMRMHIAESLVEIKKEKEKLIIDVPDITVIKDDLNKTFKDADYENLYANHGTIPENVRKMFEYTYLAKKLDIMQGDTDGYFRPYDNVTRAELITILDRVISTVD